MNKLLATIRNIESSDQISLVDLEVHGDLFSCVIIETPETAAYLEIGNTVHILFKETEVSIAKDMSGQISLRNRVRAAIKHINKSAILTELTLDYQGGDVCSIITTRSAENLKLQVGDAVTGLIKANEVSIMQITD